MKARKEHLSFSHSNINRQPKHTSPRIFVLNTLNNALYVSYIYYGISKQKHLIRSKWGLRKYKIFLVVSFKTYIPFLSLCTAITAHACLACSRHSKYSTLNRNMVLRTIHSSDVNCSGMSRLALEQSEYM